MKRSRLKRSSPEKIRAWERRSRNPLTVHPSGRARPDEPLATWCQARTPVCTGRAAHRHHVKTRAQGGTDAAANTIDVCAACHEYVHAHPTESYARGWLIRS